jgi:hypothetical protein
LEVKGICDERNETAEVYAGFNQWKGYLPADELISLCREHATMTPSRDIPGLVIARRLSLRSAPAPEFKVGDEVEWQAYDSAGKLGIYNRNGSFVRRSGANISVLFGSKAVELNEEISATVRKSPPPPEDRDAGKTSSRSVSADAKPKAVGVSDPYAAVIPDTDPRVAGQPLRDIYYRSRVRGLRLDMDRELPRTWRDRMTGELVSFDGPVGKRHG